MKTLLGRCNSIISRLGNRRIRMRVTALALGLGALTLLGGLGVMDGLVSTGAAQDITYFRIGTSRPGSHPFNIAAEIGNAISNPAGGGDCDANDGCGVPGVVGMAQTTSGAVESLQQLRNGDIDAAIVQADLVALAAAGKGPFKAAGPDPDLRAIATVGDVALQVIVPADSTVKTFADLKGKKVATNPTDSDGAASARLILDALGLPERRVKLQPMELADAANLLAEGKIDALAIVERPNQPEITALADRLAVRLIPVTDSDLAKIGKDRRDLILAHLPAGTDASAAETDTLIVPILFLVTAKTDEKVAYELARTLTVPQRGTKITSNPAASGPDAHVETTVVPLHPGVQRLNGATN